MFFLATMAIRNSQISPEFNWSEILGQGFIIRIARVISLTWLTAPFGKIYISLKNSIPFSNLVPP